MDWVWPAPQWVNPRPTGQHLVTLGQQPRKSRKIHFYELQPKHYFFQINCVLVSLKVNCLSKLMFSHISRDARKPVFGVSDQERHKSACAATEDG